MGAGHGLGKHHHIIFCSCPYADYPSCGTRTPIVGERVRVARGVKLTLEQHGLTLGDGELATVGEVRIDDSSHLGDYVMARRLPAHYKLQIERRSVNN